MRMGTLTKKYCLIAVGCLSVALGVIGIFLPLLPTVPFLLLAAYCFTRSSERLHSWLIQHKKLGPILHQYQTHRAVSRQTKMLALTSLWGSLIFSIVLLPHVHIRLFLIAIGMGVTWHLLSLRTLK